MISLRNEIAGILAIGRFSSVSRAALLATAACVFSLPLQAAECVKEKQQQGEMGEDTYEVVQSATELLTKNKTAEAIEKLAKVANQGSDYEKAIINYNLGLAYSSKNDYPSAVKAFAKALATDAMPQTQREQLQYNLGQLYIVTNQFDEGIKTLQTYVSSACGAVPAEAHIFLANALSEKKRYAEALPQIDLAIDKAKDAKEAWLQMKLAISYEMKDFKGCSEALMLLIARAPDKADYWKQLSGVLYEMKNEADSVAVLALAEKQGFLQKPADIKNLYSMYMMIEAPYKAGVLMEDALAKNKVPTDEASLGMLSDAWINAREAGKAEVTLKKLASMSDKSDYYYKLGAMYGDNERWKESREMLEKAFQKGGLKRPGEAWMRVAMASYNLKDNTGAIAALQKALTYDETRKQAGEWLHALSIRNE